MANNRGKEIDNTHLSIDTAERRGFIHRDYIAHCLRWTHVAKYVAQKGRYKTARVLDVGCGVDLPLAKMLYSSRYIVEHYLGVDYNKPERFDMAPFHTGKMPVDAYGGIDFAKDIIPIDEATSFDAGFSVAGVEAFPLPSIITCFEVLEHVEPGHCVRMLKIMYDLMLARRASNLEDGTIFISTPCWDPHVGAAGNHVSEITYTALGAAIEDLGFEIEGHWGTFASQKDFKQRMFKEYPDSEAMWNRLSAYYDSNYIATLFAPLYPDASRNAAWQLRVKHPDRPYTRKFPKLETVEGPWTSSERWEDLLTTSEAASL